jgi:hypothetical protein
MARLQQFYRETVVPKLKADLQLANPMEVPKITKITVNMGVGEAVADRKVMDAAVGDMTKITGQKPLICKSRKSIASFKLREGLAIGCKVTLRGARSRVSATSAVSQPGPSMAGAITPWVSKSRLFSPRSSTTRSTRSGAWTSQSRRQQPTTNKVARCSRLSTSRSGSKRF